MTPNTTRFRIVLETNLLGSRWLVIDPSTDKTVCQSSTWDGAVRAAIAIESPELENIPMTGFRETLRVDHLAKVIVARMRERVGV